METFPHCTEYIDCTLVMMIKVVPDELVIKLYQINIHRIHG